LPGACRLEVLIERFRTDSSRRAQVRLVDLGPLIIRKAGDRPPVDLIMAAPQERLASVTTTVAPASPRVIAHGGPFPRDEDRGSCAQSTARGHVMPSLNRDPKGGRRMPRNRTRGRTAAVSGRCAARQVLPKGVRRAASAGCDPHPLRKIDPGVRTSLAPKRPVVIYCWDSA
jgi:hypothetical protein